MAKKKTATKSETPVKAEGIGYLGKVKIKVQRKGVTIKEKELDNNGTILLFQGLGQFLLGNFNFNNSSIRSADLYIPKFLGLGVTPLAGSNWSATNYKLVNEADIGQRIILNKQNLKVDPVKNQIIVQFNALIPSETVLFGGESEKNIYELGLFSTSICGENSLLARIEIKSASGALDGETIRRGESWLVEWNLIISNFEGEING